MACPLSEPGQPLIIQVVEQQSLYSLYVMLSACLQLLATTSNVDIASCRCTIVNKGCRQIHNRTTILMRSTRIKAGRSE